MKFWAGVLIGSLIGAASATAYYEWWDNEPEVSIAASQELPSDGDKTEPSEPRNR